MPYHYTLLLKAFLETADGAGYAQAVRQLREAFGTGSLDNIRNAFGAISREQRSRPDYDFRTLFNTDDTLMSALGSRFARTESLSDMQVLLGVVLAATPEIATFKSDYEHAVHGYTLASYTMLHAARHKIPAERIRNILTLFDNEGVVLTDAKAQLPRGLLHIVKANDPVEIISQMIDKFQKDKPRSV